MTKADIQRLAQRYLDKELEEWEEEHIRGCFSFEEEQDAISSVIAERLAETTAQLAFTDYSKIKTTAETILRDN